MSDLHLIPNANPNLQMVRWLFDDLKDAHDAVDRFWFEEHALGVTIEYFPIVGWRPFYSEYAEAMCLSPVSFCEAKWMAIIDRATGEIFPREDEGCDLSHGGDLRGYCRVQAMQKRERLAQRAETADPAAK